MRNQRRDGQIDGMFEHPLENLARSYRRIVQRTACRGIALDPALHPPIHVIQKHRVRTSPATPDAAQQRGPEKQGETKPADREKHHPQILRHERQPEEVEHPVFHIQEHRRIAIDGNPRQKHVDPDQQHPHHAPCQHPFPLHIRRMQEIARSVVIDRGDGVEVRFFDGSHGSDEPSHIPHPGSPHGLRNTAQRLWQKMRSRIKKRSPRSAAQHHQPLSGAGESHVEHAGMIAAEIAAFLFRETFVLFAFE